MRAAGIAFVVTALLGCSDEAPVMQMPDAGADAGRWAPEPPRIPWLADGVPPIAPPALTPCPPGWREVHDGDVTTCDPYPETGPEACAEGSAHFPGSAGCEPVGSACPPGEWSDGLPAAGVLYVRAGAPDGGDGTRAAPFASIAEPMSAATVGTIIALTRGRWDEVVVMRQGVTIQGACAAETVLTSSTPADMAGVVNTSARGTRLRDARIEGGARPGLWVAGAGAELRVDGVIVSGVRAQGVLVALGAQLTGALLVVRDTQSRSDGTRGRGMSLESGGTATLGRVLLDRNRVLGLFAYGAGTAATLEDVAVRDTQSQASDGTFGRGLDVGTGARVTVARGLFERNHDVAVRAAEAAASVHLTDVVVRDTQSRESGQTHGRGLDLQAGASALVTRTLFERNRDSAVRAADATTSVRLEDVVVRDTLSRQSDLAHGRGLAVQTGATADIVRARLERNREVAVYADGVGTAVRLEDVVVRDTQSTERGLTFGFGVFVSSGARTEITRARLERNREIAVYAENAGTIVRLEDAVIRDTEGRELDGTRGRGLNALDAATVEVTRALLERNRELTVFAHGEGTSIRLQDGVARDTLRASCAERCADGAGGMGVGSYASAMLSISRFVVQRAALCGVQIAHEGELDLSDGEVRESTVGACVQVPGYRLSRLNASVVYVDNGANLEATDFPAPAVSDPLGDL